MDYNICSEIKILLREIQTYFLKLCKYEKEEDIDNDELSLDFVVIDKRV